MLVGGINKFLGLTDGEAVCEEARGGERKGDETILLLGTKVLEFAWELDKTIRVKKTLCKLEVIKEGSGKRVG